MELSTNLCVVALLVALVIWLVRRRPADPYLEVVRDMDAAILEEEADRCTTPFQREYALRCKAAFGLLKDTPANRKVVNEWLIKAMRDDDVRVVDVARHLPICVELALLPTEADVTASRMRRSAAFTARKTEASRTI